MHEWRFVEGVTCEEGFGSGYPAGMLLEMHETNFTSPLLIAMLMFLVFAYDGCHWSDTYQDKNARFNGVHPRSTEKGAVVLSFQIH